MKDLDCYRGLKLTCVLFYAGMGLMALGLIVGAMRNWMAVMTCLAALGFLGVVAGLVCGFVFVRCPECSGSLMAGGRIPNGLPNFCPHCGKEL